MDVQEKQLVQDLEIEEMKIKMEQEKLIMEINSQNMQQTLTREQNRAKMLTDLLLGGITLEVAQNALNVTFPPEK